MIGSNTYGHAAFKHLEANVRPFSNRLEVNATVHQGLSKITPSRPKCVGSYCHRSRNFIGFEEFNGLTKVVKNTRRSDSRTPYLGNREEVKELFGEEIIVPIVACNVRH